MANEHRDMSQAEIAELIEKIGEPVTIHYEPRNEDMSWTVSLERVPMIHDHFPSLRDGLTWMAEHRDKFPEWEKQIALQGP